jgi:hypothetical protein
MELVIYSNTTAGNNTESERVYLHNEEKIRFDYQGTATGRMETGLDFKEGFAKYETKSYYRYI